MLVSARLPASVSCVCESVPCVIFYVLVRIFCSVESDVCCLTLKCVSCTRRASSHSCTCTLAAQQRMTAAEMFFRVFCTGNPKPTLQWFKNKVPIPGANHSLFCIDSVRYPVLSLRSLFIVELSASCVFKLKVTS